MATIRKRKTARGTSYQAIIKLPRNGERITKVTTTRKDADAFVKLVQARLYQLQQKANAEGDPLRLFTKFDVLPELAPPPEPAAPTLTDTTFGAFCDEDYPRWRRLQGKDRCQTRCRQVQWWCEQLGRETRLRDIKKGDIKRALDAYAEGEAQSPGRKGKQRSPQTVDRMRAAISSVLTAAMSYDIVEANVAQGVGKYARGPSMSTGKQLSKEERARLIQLAADSGWPRMQLMVKLALATGGRMGELKALRWEDVDLKAMTATFRAGTTKNGKTRTVAFPPELREDFMRFQRASGLLFPSPRDASKPFAFRNHWDALLKAAGVECRFHDLRHTCASLLVNSGMPIHKARDVLGHSSVTVTERYLHADQGADDLHRAIMSTAVFG